MHRSRRIFRSYLVTQMLSQFPIIPFKKKYVELLLTFSCLLHKCHILYQKFTQHNELKRGKNFQFSHVCCGGCMITSKTKLKVFGHFFFTPGPLWKPSTRKISKNVDFSLSSKRKTVHCFAKMDYFQCFRSLCIGTQAFSFE